MFRSQMAAAIYNQMTQTSDAISAGTTVGSQDEPEGWNLSDIHYLPHFLQFMEEKGMDISKNKTTKLTQEMIDSADLVVSMAEEPYIPDFLKLNEKIIWWDVANTYSTSGVDEEFATKTYEVLKEKMSHIIRKNT